MAILKAQNFNVEFSYHNLNDYNEIEYSFGINLNGKPIFNTDIISKTSKLVKNNKFIFSNCWVGEDWLHTFFFTLLKTKKGTCFSTVEPPDWKFTTITWEDRREEKEKSWEGKTVLVTNEQGELTHEPYVKVAKLFIPYWEDDIELKISFPEDVFDVREYTSFVLSLTTTFSDLTVFFENFEKEMDAFYYLFNDRIKYLGNGTYEEKKTNQKEMPGE